MMLLAITRARLAMLPIWKTPQPLRPLCLALGESEPQTFRKVGLVLP
jgi:hypothetical protein